MCCIISDRIKNYTFNSKFKKKQFILMDMSRGVAKPALEISAGFDKYTKN